MAVKLYRSYIWATPKTPTALRKSINTTSRTGGMSSATSGGLYVKFRLQLVGDFLIADVLSDPTFI